MSKSRARKWLLGIGIAVGVLIAALVLALAWLLYTQSGLRFALDRGVAMMHGQFTYSSASGSLAGETTITGLRYHDADGDTLRIDHAMVALQPWALLGQRLHIRKARIDGIMLNLAPSKPSTKSGGFSLEPPLAIALDDTLLTRITVDASGKPVFAADSLAIAGEWSNRSLVLRRLELHAPDGGVSMEGTVAIAHGYPGRGNVKIDWTRNGTHYAGALTVHSDGRTAQLRLAFNAPIHANANATLKLDNSHAWTLALHAPTFDASALPALPTTIKTLALDLRGTGDARGGTLAGSVIANGHTALIDPAQFRFDGKTLTLDPLRLRSPSAPGVVTAIGVVHLDAAPMTATLDVKWDGVQLPADLVGQPLATNGETHIEGSAQQFALRGRLAIGPPGQPSNLQLDLTGTPQAIRLNALKLVQKNGGLDAHGNIKLQPRLRWKLNAVADKFNPGAILAGWNGAMDFTLATQGAITPQGPEATFKLDHAGGTLRGRGIAGSKADVRITPDNFLDGSLTLAIGNSRIHATGKPGNRIDAVVALDIASLGDWLPQASGRLTGNFSLKGAWPKLAVTGQLHGSGMRGGSRRIDTLQLTASIPDITRPGGNLDLALAGVHASGLDFDSVHLGGSGTAAAHRVQLTAAGKPLGIAMTLHGSLNTRAKKWTGTLSDVALSPQDMPAWRQQKTATITWLDGTVTVSQLCLTAGAPRLCLSGHRDAHGAISASYALQHLPMQLLATLASSPDPLTASGDISGSGQISLGADGVLNGHATLAAGAGHVAFASAAKQPLLAWNSITLDANAGDGNQHIALRGALADGGHLDGIVDIRGNAQALSGNLDADLRDLAFLGALSTEVANVKGGIAGKLQLGGTLSAPRFSGRIQTHDFSAELPRAGLKLHDGAFAMVGDPQGRLAITGQIASGKGVLHIDGSTGLSADAPLTLNLKGENVLVADIPAAHVLASPNLHIARTKGVFALTGSITIPSADVAVEKLPGQGPAQASPDVVIVDAPPAAQVAPLALDADIQVKLGDGVKVKGYGLDGSVHGQLAVRVRPGRTATGRGEIRVAGKYQAYGQNLEIERGRLLFAGTRLDDPGLDIRAVRKIRSQGITVGLSIRGTAQRPILTVFSDPAMEQAEALSYLVTGRPLDALKSGEGDTLNTAAQALGGLAGDRLAKSIGSRLGLDAGVSSSEALGGSAFTAGKYLSPRLFLSYGVGLFTPGQVITLRYTINRFLQFEAENATTGDRASFNYRIEK